MYFWNYNTATPSMQQKSGTGTSLLKVMLTLVLGFISFTGFTQTLHLTRTINYGKHITDIVFSKEPPYSPLIYVYAINSEKEKTPSKSIPEYAVQIEGMKNSWNLGSGESCIFLKEHEIITKHKGDTTIFRRYLVDASGPKCCDSLILQSPYDFDFHVWCKNGTFHLYQGINKGDSRCITFYDSLLKKGPTIEKPLETHVSFISDNKVLIAFKNKRTWHTSFEEYSLTKDSLSEVKTDMPYEVDLWSIGLSPVNDSMFLIYSNKALDKVENNWEPKSYINAMNMSGKIYWKVDILDYLHEISVLKGTNIIFCNVGHKRQPQESVIEFYSLSTGTLLNTINLSDLFPEYDSTTPLPIYLNISSTTLLGDTWEALLKDTYSSSKEFTKAMYLIVSNSTKTLKIKIQKNKGLISNKIIPLSQSALAVVIDDDIYYYSIY
jgi:hypothetical protein